MTTLQTNDGTNTAKYMGVDGDPTDSTNGYFPKHNANITLVGGVALALGQTFQSGSLPTTMAADQQGANDFGTAISLTSATSVTVTPPGNTLGTITLTITGVGSGNTLVVELYSGVSWGAAIAIAPTDGTKPVTSITGTGQWTFSASGFNAYRVRCSVYGSGTITGQLRGSYNTNAAVYIPNTVKVDGSAVYQPVIAGSAVVTGGTVTRPANTTAYASSQLVANNTSAGSVTPISFTVSRANNTPVTITRAGLVKSTTPTTNAQFRLHLWNVSPTVANGDGGALSATKSGYLGFFDIDMTVAAIFSDGARGIGAPNTGNAMICLPATGTQILYGLLEARGAYTPGNAETFVPTLELIQD